MKKRFDKIFLPVLMCAVGIAVVVIGAVYFNYISRRIYNDSTDHLEEIYSQVNRSFGMFAERNRGLLKSLDDYISAYEGDGAAVSDRINENRKYWKFSEFYFLSSTDKSCMTVGGASDDFTTDDTWNGLAAPDEPVIANGKLPDGRDATLFVIHSRGGKYNGFAYDAIAVSYTNEDLAESLNVDAFSGEAACFVVHKDGAILISAQKGGSVFGNYLTYLKAASDLDEDGFNKISSDWEKGEAGLTQCGIGGVSHCILYQPVGYQDYMLLSVVPQSVVSAGFLSVQKTTMNVLSIIFLLVGAAAIAFILIRGQNQSMKNITELRYRERMFDVLSNSVDDIFIMLDAADYSVDYISPNVERLIGIPVDEVRKDIRVLEKCAVNGSVIVPAGDLKEIPLNGYINLECEYMHQSTGERRRYRMTVYHMSIRDVRKYIFVLSDRTQERNMNEQMQEALNAARSANEAKSNFLSNMSHDIRTPMNAIVGFSVLLENEADDPEKVREYTRKITASSHHLLSLINDVLDMSKIESGKTSLNVDKFSLKEIIEELGIILIPQAKAKNQEFNVRVDGVTPEYLIGDKLRLNQILINLLSNAIKYTPENGRVDFMVTELPHAGDQYVKLRFIVRDNGIGMSGDFLKHIFTPFSREENSVTNKIQGTGLGMAITKNLVDLMGGIINVKSKPGKGSSFTVELSFALPDAGENDTAGSEKTESIYDAAIMKDKLFLIAEDNELNSEILTEMLAAEGVKCDLAVNGAEAVEKFKNSPAGHYDMILMDVQMPVMNGYEATRQIRACGHPDAADIPIAAMTANTFAEDVNDAMEAGMNGHLAKPIDMEAVKSLVYKLLKGRRKK